MHPIIAFWCVPRSVSTAFERMMMERADHEIIHEPFSACYYYSSARKSTRYASEPSLPENEPAAVLDRIFSTAERRPVFFKDMASHAIHYLDRGTLARFTNTFLIRDPRKALPSFFHKWPDITLEEAGYHALRDMSEQDRRNTGSAPVILAAKDIIEKPEGIIRAWCGSVGIPFMPGALQWKPRNPRRWDNWKGWHDDAAKSNGFGKPKKKIYLNISDHPHLAHLYAQCNPVFSSLFQERLLPVE